jgi:hypothetical protein
VETTGELSVCLLGSEEADNLQDPFMASIFGQNNDSKYQKNCLNEWRSGSNEGRGRARLGCLKLLFDEKHDRGSWGVCRSHFALVGTETTIHD